MSGVEQVCLGEQDDMVLPGQLRTVRFDFQAQPLIGGLRVFAVEWNQKREHPGALYVLQEAETESLALVGSLDDPGDVGHDERAMPGECDHAEVGLERGEGV